MDQRTGPQREMLEKSDVGSLVVNLSRGVPLALRRVRDTAEEIAKISNVGLLAFDKRSREMIGDGIMVYRGLLRLFPYFVDAGRSAADVGRSAMTYLSDASKALSEVKEKVGYEADKKSGG